MCVCVHSYLPPHTLELQNRDTNGFTAIQRSFYLANFFSFKSLIWHNMPTSSSYGVLELFPHEISFYAIVKPITTFSLHRQRACGRQRAIGTDS